MGVLVLSITLHIGSVYSFKTVQEAWIDVGQICNKSTFTPNCKVINAVITYRFSHG